MLAWCFCTKQTPAPKGRIRHPRGQCQSMAASSVERGAHKQQCQAATGAMIRWFSQAWTTVAVRRLVTRALVLLVLNVSATFAAAVEVVHPAPESAGDTRFEYYWQLLARALAVTEPDFGPLRFALGHIGYDRTPRSRGTDDRFG